MCSTNDYWVFAKYSRVWSMVWTTKYCTGDNFALSQKLKREDNTTINTILLWSNVSKYVGTNISCLRVDEKEMDF